MPCHPIYHHLTKGMVEQGTDFYTKHDIRNRVYPTGLRAVSDALERGDVPGAADAVLIFHRGFNPTFYRFKGATFSMESHREDVVKLLRRFWTLLLSYRRTPIERLPDTWQMSVERMFAEFELVVGPVGAAKCLHILAPNTFPLWDRAIAHGYGLPIQKAGRNGARYWKFMTVASQQCLRLRGEGWVGPVLKAVDEYNFGRFTKKDPRFTS
jgi:hypothetical protein